ncbi:uncharacterized protein LOC142523483 isoform X1 [Primulina tabacum]|uniref:uncharacterized protein LOC142523483 isoform X1 n=1 Tax=Primulina tabacum TaxID=48773 RepID=UPI003F597B9E
MESRASSANSGDKGKKTEKTRCTWRTREEVVLIQALKDAINCGWKSENGFKCGYLTFLEDAMKKMFPDTDLRDNPHINSKIHVWKKTHGSLVTILSKSGIGWNETDKMVEATNEAWESMIKVDNSVRFLRHRKWSYYHDWCEIFGNDRATGEHAEDFANFVKDVPNMNYEVSNDIEVGFEDVFRVVEGADDSISGTQIPSFKKTASNKSKSNKRKKLNEEEDSIVAAINSVAEVTKSSIANLVKQLAIDEKMENAMDKALDALEVIQELSAEEKFLVAELLVDNPRKLAFFLRHGNESRLSLVKRLLKSS